VVANYYYQKTEIPSGIIKPPRMGRKLRLCTEGIWQQADFTEPICNSYALEVTASDLPSSERGTLLRLITLLQLFVDEKPSWGVRELARAVQLPHTTAHRLLRKLQGEGFLELDPATQQYRIGPELFRLSLKVASRLDIERLARSAMTELAGSTHETVYLAVYVPARRASMLVAAVEPETRLRLVPDLYEYLPVHYGATGRAILAFLPAEEVEEILQSNSGTHVDRPIAELGQLRTTLAAVRAEGYAVSWGERVEGTVTMAAPFWDAFQKLRGALVLCMPQWHYSAEHHDAHARALLQATASLTRTLGGAIGAPPIKNPPSPM
jgi:DNA-binding IclR family transcriptional regulator